LTRQRLPKKHGRHFRATDLLIVHSFAKRLMILSLIFSPLVGVIEKDSVRLTVYKAHRIRKAFEEPGLGSKETSSISLYSENVSGTFIF
jgi:hypothetical protein